MNRYISLSLALGLLGGVAVVGTLRRASGANPMHRLEHADVGRAFAPRLSIPTKYRRCTPLPAQRDGIVPRATCGEDEDAVLDANAFPSVAESADSDSLEAAGLTEVIWGDGTSKILDEAISRLEKAARLAPRPVPVRLLVDLSGAHLVRAEQTQNSRDLVKGLNYALDALEREPRNEAALFNAGLALESLAIDGEAAKAWTRYLAVDSTSEWAREARQRRADLLKPQPTLSNPLPDASDSVVEAFVAEHPQEARLLGWETELGEWGAAVLQGDTTAASHLARAERLGNALVRRGGDASLADAVRAIRAASSNLAATRTLARAHRAYAVGQKLFEADGFAAADDSFKSVARSRAPSPVLLEWAFVGQVGALVSRNPHLATDSSFDNLLSRVDSVHHPAMEARVRWTWGTWLIRKGKYPEARSQYGVAAHIFERLGETEFYGSVLAHDGEAAYKGGDTLGAYRTLHQSLLTLRRHPSSVWLHNPLWTLASRAADDGMQRAAAAVYDEDVAVALRGDLPANQAEALLGRAHSLAFAGQTAAARRDLSAADSQIGKLKPGPVRDWVLQEQHFTGPLVVPRTDPRFVAGLDSAVAFFKHRSAAWLLPVLLSRVDVRLALEDVAGATADLDTATVRIQTLSRHEDLPVRAAMIELARRRFDQLVMLHVRAGRTSEALQVLERGRVSVARAAGAGGVARPRELAAPPGQVALEYALIGDTLLIWTIRGRDVNLQGHRVDRGEFLHVVERVGAALETPARAGTIQPELERLYRWLVRPVEDRLGPANTPLVILADGEVSGVPFEALYDARRGKYLLEDHSLRFVASLADGALTAPAHTGPDTALLVADPAFDPHHYPILDPLRGARAEVDSLQALYPAHDLLADTGATRAKFMARAQRAGVTVIHYAGHAVFDDTRPEQSYLVLAGDSTSGQLTADSMAALKLGGVRLVVLSACQSLRARDGRSGGFAGLSGALLAAGAGGVVGSMWDVDDSLAQPLMLAFHREYLQTHDPAEALRTAQLRQLHLRRSPAAWAGFRYAGR
jgi:CHAT domain-containing protein